MDYCDMDMYAKEAFEGFTRSSEHDLWQEISDGLDDLQHRRRKRTLGMKIAICIALMLHVPSTVKNSNHMLETISKVAEKQYIYPLISTRGIINNNNKDDQKEPILIEQVMANIAKKVERESNFSKSKDTMGELVQTDRKEEKKPLGQVIENNHQKPLESAVSSYEEVTDAELESLMERARHNVDRERALQKARAAFTTEMLANIEEEIEKENRGFYKDVKRGFAKIKTVLSN